MSRLQFQVHAQATGSHARAGTFHALRGRVDTPIFMPVGTQATVKSQTIESLKAVGSRVLLANTYHLMLRPGIEVFQKLGGIHKFMNWDGPVLTDSGGFQIFSLPHSRSMDEEGARFQSYVDGATHLLSPETSIEMQKAIGSDIMMVLDQCIPSTAGLTEAKLAMELTHRWALRSLAARGESQQSLFGIVQGACFKDLRRASADFLCAHPFDGFAIGGLAVGESKELRDEFTEFTAELLPKSLPRYLMGVGTPIDILEAVHRGVDMFDCIIPSAYGQRGIAFTSSGKIQLRRTVYRLSEKPLDPKCNCLTCKNHSQAFLHHLCKTQEVLGWTLLTHHNLSFYHRLMREIREAILNGTFLEYYHRQRPILSQDDDEHPIKPPVRKKKRLPVQTLGDYKVTVSPKGFSSILQVSSGEIMHSVNDPTEEARRLYIEQSQLADKIKNHLPTEQETLVIWDVGLGAATNAMAAIQCVQSLGVGTEKRPVKLVSFENDLNSLKLALLNHHQFKYLRHPAPHALLQDGSWLDPSGLLTWELRHGDFLKLMETAPIPEIIFYDPFSYKTDSALWTENSFSKIFTHCREKTCELYTYSASTAVRSALLASGFYVAHGASSGPKENTTIAYNRVPQDKNSLLGKDWLERWNRSDKKHFFEKEKIIHHPQFL